MLFFFGGGGGGGGVRKYRAPGAFIRRNMVIVSCLKWDSILKKNII